MTQRSARVDTPVINRPKAGAPPGTSRGQGGSKVDRISDRGGLESVAFGELRRTYPDMVVIPAG
jgi:hypothetical protein